MSVTPEVGNQVKESEAQSMINKSLKETVLDEKPTEKPNGITKRNDVEVNGEDASSDEESDSSDSTEDEPINAPFELLGEFLQYIREAKWEDAQKLCQMILIYEPDNSEALKFKPLIEEKIQIEQELEQESQSESSEEESSSDDEESAQSSDGDEEAESSSESDDGADQTEHLANKLIFLNNTPSTSIWRP